MMKVPTPEGLKEATPIEFRIENIEPSIRIVLSDGTVLLTRATVYGIFSYVNNDDSIGYHVAMNISAVKIG